MGNVLEKIFWLCMHSTDLGVVVWPCDASEFEDTYRVSPRHGGDVAATIISIVTFSLTVWKAWSFNGSSPLEAAAHKMAEFTVAAVLVVPFLSIPHVAGKLGFKGITSPVLKKLCTSIGCTWLKKSTLAARIMHILVFLFPSHTDDELMAFLQMRYPTAQPSVIHDAKQAAELDACLDGDERKACRDFQKEKEVNMKNKDTDVLAAKRILKDRPPIPKPALGSEISDELTLKELLDGAGKPAVKAVVVHKPATKGWKDQLPADVDKWRPPVKGATLQIFPSRIMYLVRYPRATPPKFHQARWSLVLDEGTTRQQSLRDCIHWRWKAHEEAGHGPM